MSGSSFTGFGLKSLATGALLLCSSSSVSAKSSNQWIDIWGSMPQLVEPGNLPPAPYNGGDAVFQNATLRQTVYITQDASTIRLSFSNAFGGSDLPITAATVALPAAGTGAGSSAIKPGSVKTITFSGGKPDFIVPNGALVVSDPIKFQVKAQSVLTVTLYLASGQSGQSITGHPGSRTTSWLAPGNLVSATNLTSAGAQSTDHWYFLSSIEAYQPERASTLYIVGDSITDGRGSTTNTNNRWPDQLLARLQKAGRSLSSISVINQAAGGNRVLADGLGPNALGRIERDVLARPGSGARYALIFEGVNDIGTAPLDSISQATVGDRLISAYEQMITRLHSRGIAAFGATITPMSGPGQAYGEPEREKTRQKVNEWIRKSGRFDAVVDFDKAVRDRSNWTMLDERWDSGDYLHLNPEGYKTMAEAVDLKSFERFADGVDVYL
ncbi:SGNH hydrolase-type esterase domain-containing protein [Pseudoneurospora amorphoporcata]|uniref:SGNH hydrolase-type esterase domain-containing protein n=1 Tax=Pseudoneurospora amorphoporcata TaxID=241081 RepID=A0AAN6NZT3_9PEZI|nr:SGNH hydrolase-type esterase domain-containing protein [Pseudoneurospora amorphoporcata]